MNYGAEKVFSHSGDAGDLIAALPTVKQLGGGRLCLYPSRNTRECMTPVKAEAMRPLLEAQDYISGAEYSDRPSGINLDVWRGHYRHGHNIADMVCSAFQAPHYPRGVPWLTVPDVLRVARVVIHRSDRYHNWNFVPVWKRACDLYRNEMVFVGHPDEHARFCTHLGPVPYYATADFLELARVIAGAVLYIGNQSAPFWVAEGLKKPLVLEACLHCQNCHWERPKFIYGVNEHSRLPALAELCPHETEWRPDRNGMSVSETAKHRGQIVQYCQGNGVDLGSSGDPVVPTALQVDLPTGASYSPDFSQGRYPVQFRGDATKLTWFRDGVLDYVFSSHLLEDFADWTPALCEWSRVLRPGGHLVIFIPEKERWAKAVADGQPPNNAHRHEGRVGELTERLNAIGGFDVLEDRLADDGDYTILFVARKRGVA